jgi:hypothetical protein
MVETKRITNSLHEIKAGNNGQWGIIEFLDTEVITAASSGRINGSKFTLISDHLIGLKESSACWRNSMK